jgi:protoporphyrinogen oxidase
LFIKSEAVAPVAEKNVVIIGAGPAGLTAAYELCKAGMRSVVLEKDSVVGGLSRTVNYKGYNFDIGGHRFFTKVKAIDDMWREVLKEGQFLRRRRLSRIYYNGRFFNYPLRTANVVFGLGVVNSILVLFSYISARMFPQKPEETFEQWVSNRFGKRLYRIFFKTYTEKVWGIPCNEIAADWAAQRIRGLSLFTAVKDALIGNRVNGKAEIIKTLIDAFDYPEKGPGMMWNTVLELVQSRGARVLLKTSVARIFWSPGAVTGLEVETGKEVQLIAGTHFISSMPMRELIQKLEPEAPSEVLKAAERLNYRDFVTVALILDKAELFPDNWIYVHDPRVRVGRIQNFKNWSPHMVPDQSKTCLGLEYFCFEDDDFWTTSDAELVRLATKELSQLGLANETDVLDATVVRMPKAYPVYDSTYMEALRTVRRFLDEIGNLYLIGRNGMHKYNNQDHSMLTAMLAVKNIQGANYDIWEVNVEQEFHEEIRNNGGVVKEDQFARLSSTQPRIPKRIQRSFK